MSAVHPADDPHVSWCSKVLLSFVSALVRRGEAVSDADLFALRRVDGAAQLSAILAAAWREECASASLTSRAPRFFSAWWRAFLWGFAPVGLATWAKAMLALAQSRAVIALLGLLTGRAEESILVAGFALVAVIGVLGLLAALSDAYYWRSTWFHGRRWQVATLALLFAKAARLRIDALSSVSTGYVISLASSDVERFLQAVHHLPHLVLAPIDFFIYASFLYADLGVACFAGLGLMIFLSLAQLLFYSRAYGRMRRERSATTDARLNLTAQVLAGIRVIKANSWEPPFLRAVRAVRAREVAQLQAQYAVRGTFEGLIHSKYLALAGATVLALWAMGEAITPQKVYSATALFYLLEMDRAWRFVENAENLADLRVSLERFSRFFQLPEAAAAESVPAHSEAPLRGGDDGGLCRSDGSTACPSPRAAAPRASSGGSSGDPVSKEIALQAAPTASAHPSARAGVDFCDGGSAPASVLEPLASLTWALELVHVVATVAVAGGARVDGAHVAVKTAARGEPVAPSPDPGLGSFDDSDGVRLMPAAAAADRGMSAANEDISASDDDIASSSRRADAVVLNDVSLRVARGELCAIVGETGAGKTSLLLALLGELTLQPGGRIAVAGRISYAPQQPVIMSGTVRENVVFGAPADEARLAAVLAAAQLDAEVSPDTVVGEKGVTLSGGQRARLGLARAIFREADVYLLDDPLSALDARVGAAIFNDCIRGVLGGRGATVLLVTHQLLFLRAAARIVVLGGGRVVAEGSYAALSAQLAAARGGSGGGGAAPSLAAAPAVGGALAALLGAWAADDDNDEILRSSDGATVGESSVGETSAQPPPRATRPPLPLLPPTLVHQEEESSRDPSSESSALLGPSTPLPHAAFMSAPQRERHAFAVEATVAAAEAAEIDESAKHGAVAGGCAATDAIVVAVERDAAIGADAQSCSSPAGSNDCDHAAAFREDGGTGAVSFATYSAYARYWVPSLCSVFDTAHVVLVLIAAAVAFPAVGAWLALWSSQSLAEQQRTQPALVYAALVVAAVALATWRPIAFAHRAVLAGRELHDAVFAAVLRARTSFFDARPAGSILSRFSKDVQVLDERLPLVACDVLLQIGRAGGVLTLVCVANPWMLLPLPLLIAAFAVIRARFVRASRAIKRLEAASRPPILSSLAEVLASLPVVRAFGAVERLTAAFHARLDANSRAWTAFMYLTRWLALRLDLLCVAFFTAAAAGAVLARGSGVSPGATAMSLGFITMLLGELDWMVRQSVELENGMLSVERLLAFSVIDGESIVLELGSDEGARPPSDSNEGARFAAGPAVPAGGAAGAGAAPEERVASAQRSSANNHATHWPQRGAIELRNVYMRYHPRGRVFALRGVSFALPPGTKLGVVGRTGAGKSSLLAALLRMTEPERRDGSGIFIDGIDTATVSLTRLRRACSVISQEPVLYAGTVRSNLDPFGSCSASECTAALDAVCLSAPLRAAGGLSAPVADCGGNLSVGQRQLLCLARAMLRKSKILYIDEATANVDADTDALIQQSIRTAFADATVICVAHRLSTVLDCDLVLVLSEGRVVQIGSPAQLAAEADGPFAALLREAERAGRCRRRQTVAAPAAAAP